MSEKTTYPCRENYRQVSIYVPTDMIGRLVQIANREKRSMNNLLNCMIDRYVPEYWQDLGQTEPLVANPQKPADTTEPAPEAE